MTLRKKYRFPPNSVPLTFASDRNTEVCIYTMNTVDLINSSMVDVDLCKVREKLRPVLSFRVHTSCTLNKIYRNLSEDHNMAVTF